MPGTTAVRLLTAPGLARTQEPRRQHRTRGVILTPLEATSTAAMRGAGAAAGADAASAAGPTSIPEMLAAVVPAMQEATSAGVVTLAAAVISAAGVVTLAAAVISAAAVTPSATG